MSLYNDLERYFNPCTNCGECCKVPGVFLPEQVMRLSEHMKLNLKDLFGQYLIAELCSPNDNIPPVFALSPVKADEGGKRYPIHFMDVDYINIRDRYCIFRDIQRKTCSIHDYKPFACELLICSKMTHDRSLSLEKSFYFYKWKNSQQLILSIFPELKDTIEKLEHSIRWLGKTYDLRNAIINTEIARIINGSPIKGTSIFK